jgi:hypothetical protein
MTATSSARNPQRIYAATVTAWGALVMCHAAWHIHSVLSGAPDPDTYANEWTFQVVAFSLVKLPYWVMTLVVILLAEFFLFGQKEKEK